MKFSKVQSIGNDFVLVLMEEVGEDALADLSVKLCARRFSVGADGLLAVARHPSGIRMRMFNPDGTEDFCGNGMRCASVWGKRQGWVDREFAIHHGGREVTAAFEPDGRVRTVLDPASYRPSDIPVTTGLPEVFLSPLEVAGETLTVSCVSTGSAHTVILCEALPGEAEFLRLGPAIENHPAFPERTSAIWAVQVGEGRLQLRIWERGVGETLGCGTGSAAAAAVWSRATAHQGEVAVVNPGGVLGVDVEPDSITLRGVAEIVYEGTAMPGTAGR